MSAMAKMNGNQGHGKAATNIWQVMNYQVPRGYVFTPSLQFYPFALFFTLLLALFIGVVGAVAEEMR